MKPLFRKLVFHRHLSAIQSLRYTSHQLTQGNKITLGLDLIEWKSHQFYTQTSEQVWFSN